MFISEGGHCVLVPICSLCARFSILPSHTRTHTHTHRIHTSHSHIFARTGGDLPPPAPGRLRLLSMSIAQSNVLECAALIGFLVATGHQRRAGSVWIESFFSHIVCGSFLPKIEAFSVRQQACGFSMFDFPTVASIYRSVCRFYYRNVKAKSKHTQSKRTLL